MKKTDYIRETIYLLELNPSDQIWASTVLIFIIAFIAIFLLFLGVFSYLKKEPFFRLKFFTFFVFSMLSFYVLYSSHHVAAFMQVTTLSELNKIAGF